MKSAIVITSWWSNCLALRCLHLLAEYAPGRRLYVAQCGKSDEQMDLFRRHLPSSVMELDYPADLPADDSAMREYLALDAPLDEDGIWFIDHDAFLLTPSDAWFDETDRFFSNRDCCLCTGIPRQGPGITQPAYWISRSRWPDGLSSFAPIPFPARPYLSRPDLYRHRNALVTPVKDTLVKVAEEIDDREMSAFFPLDASVCSLTPLPVFPRHMHLGGIHLYTGLPAARTAEHFEWMRNTVGHFTDFFASCSPEWLRIEDPELVRRHLEFSEFLEGSVPTGT